MERRTVEMVVAERPARRRGRRDFRGVRSCHVVRIARLSAALQTRTRADLAAGSRGARGAGRPDLPFGGPQVSTSMAIFKKKADPLSERSRALAAEIAALEEQIKQLDTRLQQSPAQPRLRSTARPHNPGETPAPVRDPVFEQVNHERVKSQARPGANEHPKELGVRKFDLAGAWKRLQNHFHGPPANNPKL